MDVPQSDQAFPTFMFGISGLVLVVNARAGNEELETMRQTLGQALESLPLSTRNGLPIPLVILECDTGPQKDKSPLSTWELVDLLRVHEQNASSNSNSNRPKVSWVCQYASATTGDGLLEVSRWIGRMYNVFLTIRTDD